MKQFIEALKCPDLALSKTRYSATHDGHGHRIDLSDASGALGFIEWDGDDGEVVRIYVGDKIRRCGVGAHLWQCAEEWAQENGAEAPQPQNQGR
jgi:GNAT superfamily N-acetyltransferase